MVADALASRLGAGRFARRYGGRVAEARGPAGPVTILVPETYVNLSGDAIGPAAGALRARPEQVLVIHDDLDLPFGAVRGKIGGGHGGHNGLRSVARGLGSGAFPRMRLGIGRPPAEFRGDPADWVLMRFAEPAGEVEAMVARAADMAEVALAEGMEAAINRFHASEPGERARARRERREATRADAVEPPGEDGAAG
mgnify:FL=1